MGEDILTGPSDVLGGPGTNVINVQSSTFAAKGDGVSDDTAAIQAAIDAANGAGDVLLPSGTYLLNSGTAAALKLPRNAVGLRIRGSGVGATTIKLSANTPRAFDFNKVADHDTFQNIEIADLTVDDNNVGGKHHKLLGTKQNSSAQQRINFDRIVVRRVRVINVPVDSTGVTHNCGAVYLAPNQPTASEATQNTIRRCVFEDVVIAGGNFGIIVAGTTSGAAAILNIFWDQIVLNRCRWDSGSYNLSSAGTMSGFQIGSRGSGGYLAVTDCLARGSSDVGFEFDNMAEGYVTRCVAEECTGNGFYFTNFNYPVLDNGAVPSLTNQIITGQRLVLTDCHARAVANTSAVGTGFRADYSTMSIALGTMILKDCSWYRANTNGALNRTAEAFGFNAPMEEARVDGFRAVVEGISITGAQGGVVNSLALAHNTGPRKLTLKNIVARMIGNVTGASGVTWFGFDIGGTANLTSDIDIDGIVMDMNVTGGAGLNFDAIRLGHAGTVAVRGSIKRLDILQWTGAGSGWNGVQVGPTANLTIGTQLRIEDCDFTRMGFGSEVAFTTAPQNQSKTYFYGNKWKTYPKPSAAMSAANFAAATFTTATGNQYVGGDSAEIHFATGTGAGITAIDVSKDGTTYENAYTQASGAMAQTVLVPVDNADFVKVTFATTQPTTRVRPQR